MNCIMNCKILTKGLNVALKFTEDKQVSLLIIILANSLNGNKKSFALSKTVCIKALSMINYYMLP